MWLQLARATLFWALLLLALLSTQRISYSQERETGEGKAVARTLVYDDDDATTVVSSLVGADLTLPRNTVVGVHVLLDAVSSASVDVVSAATTRWKEDRLEVGGTLGTIVRGQEVFLGVVQSAENDWRSLSFSIGSARELFQKNTRLSASLAYTGNDIGRASDPNFATSLSSVTMELAVSQLIDSKTRVGSAYSFQRLVGFQSSPYRYVTTADGTTMPETHPDRRQRHALSGFAMRSLHKNIALRGAYRMYRDDWGIWSHTASLRAQFSFANRLGATLGGRFYQQNKADFYKNQYSTSFRYMSSDRELSTFRDTSLEAGLSANIGPARVDVKTSVIRYRFRNFDRLPKRRALLLGGGIQILW